MDNNVIMIDDIFLNIYSLDVILDMKYKGDIIFFNKILDDVI